MKITFSKKLELNNPQDLTQCIKYVMCTKLWRVTGAKEHEHYSLCLYLLALYKTGRLLFPITIEILGHMDPPDFIISFPPDQLTIGLEHTRATPGSYQVAKKEAFNNRSIKWLESSFYVLQNKLPINRAFSGLRKKNEPFIGPPTYGNHHIGNWVDLVFEAIVSKNSKYGNPKHTEHQTWDLLIEVITPNLIGNGHTEGVKRLNEKVNDKFPNNTLVFRKVHIISQDRVIIDVFGHALITLLPKDEVKKIRNEIRNRLSKA
jgi:hypothetical protein